MIAFRALAFQFDRVDKEQQRNEAKRRRQVDTDENLLYRHDPLIWRSASERKRLVAYWAMLREAVGLMANDEKAKR